MGHFESTQMEPHVAIGLVGIKQQSLGVIAVNAQDNATCCFFALAFLPFGRTPISLAPGSRRLVTLPIQTN